MVLGEFAIVAIRIKFVGLEVNAFEELDLTAIRGAFDGSIDWPANISSGQRNAPKQIIIENAFIHQ